MEEGEKDANDLEMKIKASNFVEIRGRMVRTGHVVVLEFGVVCLLLFFCVCGNFIYTLPRI